MNRTAGPPFLGITFGPQIQVYYLIALYTFACTAAMFAFTRTPLGRMLNAVRDNPERVEFIGYSTQRVRYLSFVIAGFFAGIAGGMYAVHFEIATPDVVGAGRSGAYLLFTFLGGATFFFGPIIGAVLMVVGFALFSEVTKAWQLYLGLIFMFMVMYAPGGIASLLMMNLRVAAHKKLHRLWRWYALLTATALVMLAGFAALDRNDLCAPVRLGRRDDGALPRDDARHRHRDAVARCHGRGAGRIRCLRGRAQALRERLGQGAGGDRGDHDVQGAVMTTAPHAVELRRLCKSFGKTEIIRGCDLTVAPGERVGIIGPNGAGKSTLFNLISGRFGPTSGEILLNGRRIDGLKPYEINRLGLARSFQITNIFGRLSVFENLRCGLLWAMGYRYAFWKFLADLTDANERAEQLLAMIRLEQEARHAGDEPDLRRAARARDRHHHRRRRRA